MTNYSGLQMYDDKFASMRIGQLEAENKRLQNRIDIAEDCFEAYETIIAALLKEIGRNQGTGG